MVAGRKKVRKISSFIGGIFCAAIPNLASASGEDVLLFPVGQLAALVVVGIISWQFSSRSIIIRSLVIIGAVAIGTALWFTPVNSIIGSHPNQTEYFLIGLVPPTAVAVIVALVCSLFTKRSH
jgi:hypothetical protein